MKIIIAGAGDVGSHLATLLASEQQDIVLIDQNREVLENVNASLDVQTIWGDSSSLSILKRAEVGRANLFLAVTTSEKDNLVSCILAKKLGASITVARVNNQEYLEAEQQEIFHNLGVDHLISPTVLAAEEISRLLEYQGVTDVFSFEEDKINLFGIFLDATSDLTGQTIYQVNQRFKDFNFKPIAILRGRNTVLPESHVVLSRNDHVYFLTDKDHRNELLEQLGILRSQIKKVMIIGGGTLGQTTARLLEQSYEVTIVEEDKNLCKKMVASLDDTLVVKGDPGDYELLKEEGLGKMDAFLALTPNSETNILTSLMASEHGVKKTVALVDNVHYIHISQHIGVDTLINKKLISANNIFRFVRKGKIEAIASLHGVEAEVIEFIIHKKNNQLTKKAIGQLKMPKGAIIGSVFRDEELIVPDLDFTFKQNDRVIVLSMPEAIHKVESLFK